MPATPVVMSLRLVRSASAPPAGSGVGRLESVIGNLLELTVNGRIRTEAKTIAQERMRTYPRMCVCRVSSGVVFVRAC